MEIPEGKAFTIKGVCVYFPHKPYPSQLSMMDKIIGGLEKEQNCLLESPTGSGKSLALLCAALAWLTAEKEKLKSQAVEREPQHGCQCSCHNPDVTKPHKGGVVSPKEAAVSPKDGATGAVKVIPDIEDLDDDFKPDKSITNAGNTSWKMECTSVPSAEGECGCSCGSMVKKVRLPKVYFGTRTHKQIAQIARELGKTAYRHSLMCILASREHTCIDPEVSRMPNKNEECKNKLDGPGCRFNERVRSMSYQVLKDRGLDSAWDLDDFVKTCKTCKACPYYTARFLRDSADIIFCPYNYLIDSEIRKNLDINLKNQIVILDEAHNIEDSARESASFSFTQKHLKDAMDDIYVILGAKVKVDQHTTLLRLLQGLADLIERNAAKLENNNQGKDTITWEGPEMVAQIKMAGGGPEEFPSLLKCLTVVTDDESGESGNNRRDRKPHRRDRITSASIGLLGSIIMVLGYIYKQNMKYMADYRVVMVKTFTMNNLPTGNVWMNAKSRKGHKKAGYVYKLNFWCLNPAVAFSDLTDVRTIVLTSGTLSPLTSFQSELGVSFPIQLEAGHVIGRSQVWVGALSRGPRGRSLLGSYQTAETFEYQDELGDVVLNVCQTVPYGVLLFLSSYKALEKFALRWQTTGLWEKICQCKHILREPRAGGDFDEIIRQFYDIIKSPNKSPNGIQYEDEEEQEGEEDNMKTNKNITGALFMAVCRGKVSEGLDFADNNARAVITVGIPFPNIKDTQVELKKQYNNKHCASRGLLNGRDWYEIQAYRALNQALGRCIRHREDWGALILVDERFAKAPQKYVQGLSKWVRNRVQFHSNFQFAMSSLEAYTKEREQMPATDDVSMMTQSTVMNATITDSRTPVHPPPIARYTSTPMADSNTYPHTGPAIEPVTPCKIGEPSTPCQKPPCLNVSQSGGFFIPEVDERSGLGNRTLDMCDDTGNATKISRAPVQSHPAEASHYLNRATASVDSPYMHIQYNSKKHSTRPKNSDQGVTKNIPVVDVKQEEKCSMTTGFSQFKPSMTSTQVHRSFTPVKWGSDAAPVAKITPVKEFTKSISECGFTPVKMESKNNDSCADMKVSPYKFVNIPEKSEGNITCAETKQDCTSPDLFGSENMLADSEMSDKQLKAVLTELDVEMDSAEYNVESSICNSPVQRKPLFKSTINTKNEKEGNSRSRPVYHGSKAKMKIEYLEDDDTKPESTNAAESTVVFPQVKSYKRRLSRNKLKKDSSFSTIDRDDEGDFQSHSNRANGQGDKIIPCMDNFMQKENDLILPDDGMSIDNPAVRQCSILYRKESVDKITPEKNNNMNGERMSKRPHSDSEDPVIRKSARSKRRNCNVRITPNKKAHTSSTDDIGKKLQVVCPTCRKELFTIDATSLSKPSHCPAFAKFLCRGDLMVCEEAEIQNVRELSHKLHDVELNSTWSSGDHACVQWIEHHAGGKKKQCAVIGAVVKATSEGSHSSIATGQVWLTKECLPSSCFKV